MLAHIAGIPAEETALGLAPVAGTLAGCIGLRLRGALRRDRRRRVAGERDERAAPSRALAGPIEGRPR